MAEKIIVADRVPMNPGRVEVTPEGDGIHFILTRADNPISEGTRINKALFDKIISRLGLVRDTISEKLLYPELETAFYRLEKREQVNFGGYPSPDFTKVFKVSGTKLQMYSYPENRLLAEVDVADKTYSHRFQYARLSVGKESIIAIGSMNSNTIVCAFKYTATSVKYVAGDYLYWDSAQNELLDSDNFTLGIENSEFHCAIFPYRKNSSDASWEVRLYRLKTSTGQLNTITLAGGSYGNAQVKARSANFDDTFIFQAGDSIFSMPNNANTPTIIVPASKKPVFQGWSKNRRLIYWTDIEGKNLTCSRLSSDARTVTDVATLADTTIGVATNANGGVFERENVLFTSHADSVIAFAPDTLEVLWRRPILSKPKWGGAGNSLVVFAGDYITGSVVSMEPVDSEFNFETFYRSSASSATFYRDSYSLETQIRLLLKEES